MQIAVNRAILHAKADYWCFNDFEVAAECPGAAELAECIIFTHQDCHRELLSRQLIKPSVPVTFHAGVIEMPADLLWARYTVLSAVVLAYSLGAKRILLYGADMCGEAEFDGRAMENINRTEIRWNDERSLLANLARFLEPRGVVIERVLVKHERI